MVEQTQTDMNDTEIVQETPQTDCNNDATMESQVPDLVPAEEEKKEEPTAQEGGRQPHHRDAKPGRTDAQLNAEYIDCIFQATSICVCNYSSLTMAINMGFAGRKQIASDLNQDQF